MQTPISVDEKKTFIKWFLNHYQLKKRESVWILNYLCNNQDILYHVHFVRDIKSCPRALKISSRCSKEVSFRYYKKHIVTTDADKAFHDIRLNPNQELYIQLNFKNAHQNPYFAAVLEENPFMPDEAFITEKDQHLAKKILDQTLYEYKKKSLQQKIDHSLDEMDRIKFMKLVEELKELEETYSNQPKILK